LTLEQKTAPRQFFSKRLHIPWKNVSVLLIRFSGTLILPMPRLIVHGWTRGLKANGETAFRAGAAVPGGQVFARIKEQSAKRNSTFTLMLKFSSWS
jgi:hypothetical protein